MSASEDCVRPRSGRSLGSGPTSVPSGSSVIWTPAPNTLQACARALAAVLLRITVIRALS
eukprot:7848636-Alexandrium_andersonii.AAC.1